MAHSKFMRAEPTEPLFQQLLDPQSLLSKNARGLNVVLLRIEDWLPASANREAVKEARDGSQLEQTANDVLQALRSAAQRRYSARVSSSGG